MTEEKKTVSVLGSTGSIGTQTLDVVREGGLSVKLLAAHKNAALLAKQIAEFHPEKAICADRETADAVASLCDLGNTALAYGKDALDDTLRDDFADLTVHAIAGLAGLDSALSASRTKTRLCMANKEAIICAGELIFANLRESGGELIPVDSEHSAIFQCLAENRAKKDTLPASPEGVKRLILTASGGPFFGKDGEFLKTVTPETALAHPTWKMGPKITVDSATLMNKGFEIVEAARLFGVPHEKVDVVVHRQSIIHSMVEYTDNTVIAQLGLPDMRSAIRYSFTYPARGVSCAAPLDLCAIGSLTFEKPDTAVFPLLDAGRMAYDAGGTALCSLIGADEVAVDAFLRGSLRFDLIAEVVFETLSKIKTLEVSEENLAEADREAREIAGTLVGKYSN
jgi:1-deoxy-D-xylulose-5-phosphate reductoisomerase